MSPLAALALALVLSDVSSAPASPTSAPAPAGAGQAAVPLLPAAPSWTELRLEARKGLLRGSVTCRARRVAADAVRADLRPWPGGGERPPEGDVVVFETLTTATFRADGRRTTWLDARGLLQDDGREGRRLSFRRLGDVGLYQWKTRGAGRGAVRDERLLPWEAPVARPVVDFASLMWLATAHGLHREGARLDVAVLAKGRPRPLDLVAGELEEVETGRDAARRHVAARHVRVAAEDEEESLFGLRGDVDLYLDAATGLPLELRGTMQHLGAVRVRVVAVTPEP